MDSRKKRAKVHSIPKFGISFADKALPLKRRECNLLDENAQIIHAYVSMRFIFCALFLLPITIYAQIVVHFRGRLGNQLFQAATAIALAQENQCGIYFPDFERLHLDTDDYGLNQLKQNYQAIFCRIPCLETAVVPEFIYREPDFAYHPIPYQPRMEIEGYFLSEKHFSKYRDLIVKLFAATEETEQYLQTHFSDILQHPKTVGIHVRTGYLEYSLNHFNPDFYKNYLPPDMEFFKQAMSQFEEDALFVVFSDHIDWCKRNFAGLGKNIVFIEDQDYLYDFYLLSKCKHAIIANSSFCWWAAYLNANPEKKVICRMPFWNYGESSNRDIIPTSWTSLHMQQYPPVPKF